MPHGSQLAHWRQSVKPNPGGRGGTAEAQGGARTADGAGGEGVDQAGRVRGHSRRTAPWRRTCSPEHRARRRGRCRGPFARCSTQPGQAAALCAARPP